MSACTTRSGRGPELVRLADAIGLLSDPEPTGLRMRGLLAVPGIA